MSSEKGCVPKALTMWKASSNSGEYHDNVNIYMSIKWLTEKLMKNFEPRSVLVFDNVACYNLQVTIPQTSKSRIQHMTDWLCKYNISFSDDM